MNKTTFSSLAGVDEPLVGFSRSPGVVAAVTEAGGLGVLAASGYTPPELDAQLTWIESRVKGKPYGVDLLIPEKFVATDDSENLIAGLRAQIPQQHIDFVQGLLVKYGIPTNNHPDDLVGGDFGRILAESIRPEGAEALLDVAFAHDIRLVANALGPAPADLVARSHAADVVVAALVGAPKHVSRQVEVGVDVIVAQGTEAGGHTGTIATMVLTPEVVDMAEDRPVLAAGGVASGRQMAAALALGAAGVWCGSVWLSSVEDITPDDVKSKFISASSSDTVRSPTRTGKPARQLRTAWHEEWAQPGSPSVLPMPLQPLLVSDAWAHIGAAAADGHEGALELQSYYIGQVVGSFRTQRSAYEIARELIEECGLRLEELGQMRSSSWKAPRLR
jgi:NAD(P)H-dependent flavin oxidoreductase YrpB (nitropropane dioxygenase family)